MIQRCSTDSEAKSSLNSALSDIGQARRLVFNEVRRLALMAWLQEDRNEVTHPVEYQRVLEAHRLAIRACDELFMRAVGHRLAEGCKTERVRLRAGQLMLRPDPPRMVTRSLGAEARLRIKASVVVNLLFAEERDVPPLKVRVSFTSHYRRSAPRLASRGPQEMEMPDPKDVPKLQELKLRLEAEAKMELLADVKKEATITVVPFQWEAEEESKAVPLQESVRALRVEVTWPKNPSTSSFIPDSPRHLAYSPSHPSYNPSRPSSTSSVWERDQVDGEDDGMGDDRLCGSETDDLMEGCYGGEGTVDNDASPLTTHILLAGAACGECDQWFVLSCGCSVSWRPQRPHGECMLGGYIGGELRMVCASCGESVVYGCRGLGDRVAAPCGDTHEAPRAACARMESDLERLRIQLKASEESAQVKRSQFRSLEGELGALQETHNSVLDLLLPVEESYRQSELLQHEHLSVVKEHLRDLQVMTSSLVMAGSSKIQEFLRVHQRRNLRYDQVKARDPKDVVLKELAKQVESTQVVLKAARSVHHQNINRHDAVQSVQGKLDSSRQLLAGLVTGLRSLEAAYFSCERKAPGGAPASWMSAPHTSPSGVCPDMTEASPYTLVLCRYFVCMLVLRRSYAR